MASPAFAAAGAGLAAAVVVTRSSDDKLTAYAAGAAAVAGFGGVVRCVHRALGFVNASLTTILSRSLTFPLCFEHP